MRYMSIDMMFKIKSTSLDDTLKIGERIGAKLSGGEIIELVGDLGSGKTVFTKGLARGIKSKDLVQSPSFTISRIYKGSSVEIHHYDFYRLQDPGILREQIKETLHNSKATIVIEWSDIVKDILPKDILEVKVTTLNKNERLLELKPGSDKYKLLIKEIV
jgi:tRNA threonylcarbamoyladenosine biosynthesis protein TsaE